MNRRSALTMVLGLLLIAGVLAVDVIAPPPEPATPSEVEPAAVTPVAGTSTCVVGDGRDGTELAVTAARPGEVGEGPAELELVTFDAGDETIDREPPLFPGAHTRIGVDASESSATSVSWRRAPVAIEREWRIGPTEAVDADEPDEPDETDDAEETEDADGTGDADDAEDADEADDAEETEEGGAVAGLEEGVTDELPVGTIAGPCPSTISDRWVVPGMITVGGSEARLRIANPFGTDATVAVGFVTPEGPEQPLALQNLSIPAQGTLEVDVNEVLPERDDLAAVVRVLSGRAIVEGYQLTRAAIGDIDGASLLAASTAPAESWTVPWVADGEDDDAWLWVVNLGDRPAPVELTLHTSDGGIPPEGLSEVTVAPGQLRRIDLRGTFPEGVGSAGVTARSDGAPIHVSGVVQRQADDPAGTGFAVQLGVPERDASWVVTGGAIEDERRERLYVVNPGSDPAELSVVLFDGSSVTEPEALTGLTVGPGERQQLNIENELAGASSWSAFITASGGEVVVGRLGAGGSEDGLHMVTVPGTPARAWGATAVGLPARAVPGTVQRLGTTLGVRPASSFPEDGEAPTPPPVTPAPDGTDAGEGGDVEVEVDDAGVDDAGVDDAGVGDAGADADGAQGGDDA
jgi:hypothetical protein